MFSMKFKKFYIYVYVCTHVGAWGGLERVSSFLEMELVVGTTRGDARNQAELSQWLSPFWREFFSGQVQLFVPSLWKNYNVYAFCKNFLRMWSSNCIFLAEGGEEWREWFWIKSVLAKPTVSCSYKHSVSLTFLSWLLWGQGKMWGRGNQVNMGSKSWSFH